ncbi:MAG: hypothetical protein Q4D99_00790 [Bacillota bacterium]|nr:hypothetical protein [Bacillota bacterium]
MYAVNNQGRIIFREYSKTSKNEKHLRKDSERFYILARRKYLELLIKLLEYRQDPNSQTIKEHAENVDRLDKLISNFEKAGVDFTRIMLTDEQYACTKANYRRKRMGQSIKKYTTPGGVATRSKSEQKLGTRFEYFGIPYRYEMKIRVNVETLVNALEEELRKTGWLKRTLFYYDGNECIWNVPAKYAWMNERGSMWKSYDAKANEIIIYPDFIFLLRDGSLLVWEHEGMASDFRYRCNASERIFVLRETGTVAENNLVFSFERDINDEKELDRMIMTHLIPRILF